MIGKLKGLIDSYGEDYVILDVGGVGYQVHCSSRTLQALPSPGEAAVLSIETYVREDQIKLFGFRSDTEREWFRLLQTVQGVGAKVALAVLGTLPPADLANAIALRDKAAVARTPGRRPEGRRAHRHRIEGQGAGLRQCRSGAGASVRRASTTTARRARSPMRSRRWSISATASRRRRPPSPPPRAAPARTRRPRSSSGWG